MKIYNLNNKRNNMIKNLVVASVICLIISTLLFSGQIIKTNIAYLALISCVVTGISMLIALKMTHKLLKQIVVDNESVSFTFRNNNKNFQTYNIDDLQCEFEGDKLTIKDSLSNNLIAVVFQEQFESVKQWQIFIDYIGKSST